MRFALLSLLFSAALFFSVLNGIAIIYALFFGLLLFSLDALSKGYSLKQLGKMIWSGVYSVRNVLIVFTLVGFLTGAWRASGTIAYLVYYGINLINPSFFLLFCFLLTLAMSMLIGSVTGTVTTMGVILISLARAGGIDLTMATGAILSGSMFGDRMSPVSSAANLVAGLTGTELSENIRTMWKSSMVPTILTGVIFLLISLFQNSPPPDKSVIEGLTKVVNMSHLSLIPAAAIIIMSLLKVKTKIMLLISTMLGVVIGVLVQNIPLNDIIQALIFGFNTGMTDPVLSKIVNGGGFDSMRNTIISVSLSASFFGIFSVTGFLKPVEDLIEKLESKIGYYLSLNFISSAFSMVFSTQTMAVMLVNGLYTDKVPDNNLRMLDLANVPILIPALIPWNMAASVAITVYEVSALSVVFNLFCWITPIYYYFYRKKFKKSLDI